MKQKKAQTAFMWIIGIAVVILVIIAGAFVYNQFVGVTPTQAAGASAAVSSVVQETQEGKVAQIMHVGPYSEEGPTVQKVHDFIKNEGGIFDGQTQKHHEIYLSDPRKANPATMKTVIRQPFT